MTVLVTGGTGFIGSNLADRLVESGNNVLVSVRKQSNTSWVPSHDAEVVETDLLELEKVKSLLKGVDTVFHLASIRGSGWVYTDEQIRDANVRITENLLRASAGVVEHFIYISSVSVHGHLNGETADEGYPYRPITRYGRTKYESELLVKKYHGEKGLVTTIMRPVITYGPRDIWGMIPKLVRLINSKKYLTVGSGENKVHLIYIDDLVDGLLLTLDNTESHGETLILAGKRPITINSLVGIVERILKKNVPKIHVPIWFARVAARLMETVYRPLLKGKEPIITRDKIDIMTIDRAYNIGRAKKLLGFSPAVDYENGLDRTIHWLKEANLIH